MPKTKTIELRFWGKVSKWDCWNWTGARNRAGYGLISNQRPKLDWFAHRISWELHYGKIPEGLFVLHRCDNPSCVNPKHLFLGTAKDNALDMSKKGRHGVAKMSYEIAEEIRKTFCGKRGQIAAMARKYGVCSMAIYHILKNIHYKNESYNSPYSMSGRKSISKTSDVN